MKHLLNILYVTQPDCYLALEKETVRVCKDDETLLRIPLLNLEGIVSFGYTGASPKLMGECAERGIGLTFLSMSGRFLARVVGKSHGNVTLRKEQYRISDDENKSLLYAKSFLAGKLHNHRWILERATRDNPMRLDVQRLKTASAQLAGLMKELLNCENMGQLRGLEGSAATIYFREFDQLILNQTEDFVFSSRQRRPPTDPVNALLSFGYTLLAHDCAAALEAVGLDTYVGFLHRDRPGRVSLALDLMEELRGVIVDRFILTMINRRELTASDFSTEENGAVSLKDDKRKEFLNAWQQRKKEQLTHPFLEEKMPWGLVPHVQALLLVRTLRGDLDVYPPFFWK